MKRRSFLRSSVALLAGRTLASGDTHGANPAEVRQGARTGLRTLAREDDLGLEPMHALDEPQRKVAIVDANAYDDILTAASRKAALQGQPSGLAAAQMNARQFETLRALMEEYAHNVPDELAEHRMA